ncbi:MAG: peptidylprolyl isomerase, partial [Pseudomonadota bacterium]
ACQDQAEQLAADPLVSEDDVLLVLVDGEPITLPMLEFTMEDRGITEQDQEGMRSALDDLIRLQAVANAAKASGLADEPRVRALRRLRDLEALQQNYFLQLAEDEPVTEDEIMQVYQARTQISGDQQYQIETVVYGNQPAVLTALGRLESGEANYETLLAEARANGLPVDQPLWVDLSQVPPEIGRLLQAAGVGDVLSLPLQTPQGWRLVHVTDTRSFELPPLEDVRQGIVRAIARERVEAQVDVLYEAAEITPMLPMDDEAEGAEEEPAGN